MTRYILALAITAGAVSPALANFYVVRGPDNKCKVVTARPTDKTMVMVGDKGYATKKEAKVQAKACK